MSNPLTEANPDALDELFNRDPLELTPENVNEITRNLVRIFRAQREAWVAEENKAKLTGKRVSGSATKKKQREQALKAIKEGPAKVDLSDILKL